MPQTPGAVIPSSGVLLHIGPRKTATTTIQIAFAAGRQVAKEHGVLYPNTAHRKKNIPNFTMDDLNIVGLDIVGNEQWSQVSAEVAGWQGRCFASNEKLERVSVEDARKVVAALGGDRVSVLITARRLSGALPSLWQQLVKRRGLTQTLETWVVDRLNDETDPIWNGQRIDELAKRWGQVVGEHNVYILPIDLPGIDVVDCVGSLLGMPPGVLPVVDRNLGMTASETELLRQRNLLVESGELPAKGHARIGSQFQREVRDVEPRPTESKPVLPDRLLPQIRAIQREIVDGLLSGDFQVLADISAWNTPRMKDYATSPDTLFDPRDGPSLIPAYAVAALWRVSSAVTSALDADQGPPCSRPTKPAQKAPTRLNLSELARRIKPKLGFERTKRSTQ